MTTFSEGVDAQCRQMMHAARRLDEKGYIVFVMRLNQSGDTSSFLYTSFNAALEGYYHRWRRRERRGSVIVRVWPAPRTVAQARATGRPFDYPFYFTVDVPRVLRCRPIVVALELMATRQKGRTGKPAGSGMLRATELSNRFEFAGTDRAALETVLRVLEMDHHREALLKV